MSILCVVLSRILFNSCVFLRRVIRVGSIAMALQIATHTKLCFSEYIPFIITLYNLNVIVHQLFSSIHTVWHSQIRITTKKMKKLFFRLWQKLNQVIYGCSLTAALYSKRKKKKGEDIEKAIHQPMPMCAQLKKKQAWVMLKFTRVLDTTAFAETGQRWRERKQQCYYVLACNYYLHYQLLQPTRRPSIIKCHRNI